MNRHLFAFFSAFFVLLVLCSLAYASENETASRNSRRASSNSFKLIQKSYSAGEIDYRTALNYKLDAIFNRKSLPREYFSEAPIKTATAVVLEALENPGLLLEKNRAILSRPTDSYESYPGHSFGSGVTVLTYNSPGGNFKIHYTENNNNGDAVYGYDGNPSTIPEFVSNLASYLDTSWDQVITNLGYTAPPSDGNAGGDERLDVYLIDMNAYGYTSYDSSPSSTYIVIENDFTGFPDNLDTDRRMGSLKVTAAHEFSHTSHFQYSTDLETNGWWTETSATWIEDHVFSSVKDYLNYAGYKYDDANNNGSWDSGETFYKIDGVTVYGTNGRPEGWFDHPEYPLDSITDTHEYGSVIWAKFLSERYGNDIIRSVWERIGAGSAALEAVSEELISMGTTIDSVFSEFQLANYTRDYADGDYYPLVKHLPAETIEVSLDHLSSVFFGFNANENTSTLELTFTNMHSGNLAAKLIMTRNDGEYDTKDITLDSYSVTAQVSDFGLSSVYSKVALTIMNISENRDDESFTFPASGSGGSTNTFTGGSSTLSTGSSGGSIDGEGSGNCFIATAAYGSYLHPDVEVLRKFRDDHLLTNPAGKTFVELYYNYSPPAADIISGSDSLRAFVRLMLTPMVYFLKYPQGALALFFMAAVPLLIYARKPFLKKYFFKRP